MASENQNYCKPILTCSKIEKNQITLTIVPAIGQLQTVYFFTFTFLQELSLLFILLKYNDITVKFTKQSLVQSLLIRILLS